MLPYFPHSNWKHAYASCQCHRPWKILQDQLSVSPNAPERLGLCSSIGITMLSSAISLLLTRSRQALLFELCRNGTLKSTLQAFGCKLVDLIRWCEKTCQQLRRSNCMSAGQPIKHGALHNSSTRVITDWPSFEWGDRDGSNKPLVAVT